MSPTIFISSKFILALFLASFGLLNAFYIKLRNTDNDGSYYIIEAKCHGKSEVIGRCRDTPNCRLDVPKTQISWKKQEVRAKAEGDGKNGKPPRPSKIDVKRIHKCPDRKYDIYAVKYKWQMGKWIVLEVCSKFYFNIIKP